MNRIRLATPDEVEKIKEQSDLDNGCTVLALDTQRGTGMAVRRVCQEVDPMFAGIEWDTRLRALFVRDIETVMAAQGVSHYYFNVDATDTDWIGVVKNWGAEQVSDKPVLRFKRTL